MHMYQMNCLQILATRFGRYLGTENATLHKTRASGARICVEIDLMDELVQLFFLLIGKFGKRFGMKNRGFIARNVIDRVIP